VRRQRGKGGRVDFEIIFTRELLADVGLRQEVPLPDNNSMSLSHELGPCYQASERRRGFRRESRDLAGADDDTGALQAGDLRQPRLNSIFASDKCKIGGMNWAGGHLD
jgi:hypothetical protein